MAEMLGGEQEPAEFGAVHSVSVPIGDASCECRQVDF